MLDSAASRILRAKAFAHLALVDEKGRPHVTPVWVDLDDEGHIIVNTAEGRVKARLMQIGVPVALSATDPETPYHYVSVRGTVVERTHEGADQVINDLSQKYLTKGFRKKDPQEKRVTLKIKPDRVFVY